MNNPTSITTVSLSRNATGDAETVERVRLAIGGMTCAGCAAGVSGALNAVDGVQNAVVNLASEQAIVDLRLGGDLKALQVAVTAAGYEATPLEAGAAVEDDRSNAQRHGWLVAASALMALPLVGQMVTGWAGYGYSLEPWMQFALATPVQFLFGWRLTMQRWKTVACGTYQGLIKPLDSITLVLDIMLVNSSMSIQNGETLIPYQCRVRRGRLCGTMVFVHMVLVLT